MRFLSYLTRHPIPSRQTLREINPLTWYGALWWTLALATLIIAYSLIATINNRFLVAIPARGGTITEGIIGAPRLINPLLATTDTDVSLTRLVYNGLLSRDGSTPDLAASYSISPDNLTYTFTLKDKLKWSDGKALTSADVAFTMSKLVSFSYISVSTPDEQTIVFTLPSPENTFISKLTVGIIPKHVWEGLEQDTPSYNKANLVPVGSGPFKIRTILSDNSIPVEMRLVRNKHYAGEKPYLDGYRIHFFDNQSELLQAINQGSIDVTMSATSDTMQRVVNDDFSVSTITSTKTISLVRLPGEPALANPSIVRAVDGSIDKASILATVEHGYGILPTQEEASDVRTPLTISINVENDPHLLEAAQALAQELGSLGITTSVKAFDYGTFQDSLTARQFGIALVESSEIPAGYQSALVLYTLGYPFLYTHDVHPILPDVIRQTSDRYDRVTRWHTKIDNVWKLFSK